MYSILRLKTPSVSGDLSLHSPWSGQARFHYLPIPRCNVAQQAKTHVNLWCLPQLETIPSIELFPDLNSACLSNLLENMKWMRVWPIITGPYSDVWKRGREGGGQSWVRTKIPILGGPCIRPSHRYNAAGDFWRYRIFKQNEVGFVYVFELLLTHSHNEPCRQGLSVLYTSKFGEVLCLLTWRHDKPNLFLLLLSSNKANKSGSPKMHVMQNLIGFGSRPTRSSTYLTSDQRAPF